MNIDKHINDVLRLITKIDNAIAIYSIFGNKALNNIPDIYLNDIKKASKELDKFDDIFSLECLDFQQNLAINIYRGTYISKI